MTSSDGESAPRKSDSPGPPWLAEGRDPSRVLALSDGVFAFAMTLLVLGLALPMGYDGSDLRGLLGGLRPAFAAYVLSFFVIWFYWRGHHLIFVYITSYDRLLLQLNVFLLLFIAVMPFATNLIAAASGHELAVILYAATQVGAGGSMAALWAHAARGHRHIPPDMPKEWIRYLEVVTLVTPVVFAVSILIAVVNPVWAEYSWLALFAAQFAQIAYRRKSKATPAAGSPPLPG